MRRSIFTLLATGLLVATITTNGFAAEAERPARRAARSQGSGVEGQTILRLHGGFSSPTGDFGDVFDGGLGFGVNVAHGIGRSVLLSMGVAYHGFDGDGFAADARVIPFTFNVDAFLPSSGRVHPWIGGGMGLYNVEVETDAIYVPLFGVTSVSADETNFGINFGAGLGAPAGSNGVWGVGLKYHHVFDGDIFSDLDFVTMQVGYGFYL